MKTIIISLILLLVPFLASADPLTLEQCIERGLSNNPQVEAYRISVQESEQGVNEAWGAFLPTMSMSYGHNVLKNGASGERNTDYLDQSSDSFTARLIQPLFAGFSGVSGLKRARQSHKYRQLELQYMQQQLARNISSSFYDWLLNQQLAEKWKESIARLQQQSDIASAWVEQRLASRLRLLEIQVELSNARHELIRVQSSRAIAEAQLREWLALDADHPLAISGDLQNQRIEPFPGLDICLAQALEQRLDLRLAQLQIDLARQDVKTIRARNLPRAQLEASWVDYQRDYDVASYPDDNRDYYSLTLNLSMQFFQGGRTLSAWRKQKLTVERYQQQLFKQRNAIVTDVRTRYQQLKESRERIHNANVTLDEAREAYLWASKAVELGVVSLNDLLDAELRLTRAEVMLINSRSALLQAQIQLSFAVAEDR